MKSLENSFYAPILVFVHTRFDHFKICIESLLKCSEAKYSHLFISSDFQRNDDEKVDVDLIRNYVKTIKGFKSVTPIFFNKNVGIQYASKFSTNKIFESYDQIIMLEDDIEVSPFFLNYINKGLDFYKNDPKVFSICGFSPFLLSKEYKNIDSDIFFSKRWNAWGFGIWKSKLVSFLENMNITDVNLSEVKKYSIEYYIQFLLFKKEKIKLPYDINVGIYCICNDIYNVYPTKTLTFNTGHDGSGLRSGNNKFFNQLEYNFEESLPQFYLFNPSKIKETAPTLTRHFLFNKIKILLINIRLFSSAKKIFKLFK